MIRGWVLVALAACGDNAAPGPNDADVCAGTTTFRGVVRAFSTTVPFDQFPRLADTEVCNADRADQPCTTTDANGVYELACVTNGDAMISFAHAGYAHTVWLRVATGATQDVDATLLTDDQHSAFYSPVGATFPKPGYGAVGLNDTTHLDGIALSAVGAEGPFYSPDGITLDPTATGTTGDGVVFFIAPTGTLSIEIAPPTATSICGQAAGGYLSTGHGLTVPVQEHTEADILISCR
jgi:hypothetical protein